MLNVNWVPGITLESMEKACILQALKFYRGNKSQTAVALGVSVKTIDNKLEKYEKDGQLERERYDREKVEREKIYRRFRGIPEDAVLEESQSGVYRADAGVHMEPAPEISAQQAVPVSESKEVQSVLPKPAAARGQSGRR